MRKVEALIKISLCISFPERVSSWCPLWRVEHEEASTVRLQFHKAAPGPAPASVTSNATLHSTSHAVYKIIMSNDSGGEVGHF